jgi:hypothetical protein
MVSAILHELANIITWPMNTGKHGGYNYWSGNFAPNPFDIGIIAALWHRHNCHEPGCWRVVRHGRTLCRHHTPPGPLA